MMGVMARPRTASLVGRDAELGRLLEAVTTARQGHLSVVLVEGEAGIGKSRLVADAIDTARVPGDLLMTGHGIPLIGDELPFGVITDALRDLVRRHGVDTIRDAVGDPHSALGALVPGLFDAAAGSSDRAHVFDACAGLLGRLSEDHLVWLWLEDLHWVDTSSRDLLGYVVRVLPATSRLLITVSRRTMDGPANPVMDRFVAELLRDPGSVRISLDRLSRGQVTRQVAALGRTSPTPEFLDRLIELSDGVPYLVEELVIAELDPADTRLDSVNASMLGRVAELSPAAQVVAGVASLGEGHLRHHLIRRVCALVEEREFEAAVAETVLANVLEVTEAGDAYRFRHALLRQAVAESVLPGDRLVWHRRWAEAIEGDPLTVDRSFARITAAHHWAQSDQPVRAFDAALEAADLARELAAPAERARLLDRVLGLWQQVPDAAERAGRDRDDVLEETLQSYDFAEELEPVAALVERELRELDHAAGDPLRLLYLRLQQVGAAPDSIQLSQALSILRDAPSTRMFVRTTCLVMWGFVPTGERALVDALLARAIETAAQLGTPWDQVWTDHTHALIAFERDDVEMGNAYAEKVLARARAECSAAEVAVIESSHAWWLYSRGRLFDSAELGRRALTRVVRPEQARWVWLFALENLFPALLDLGRWSELDALLGGGPSLDTIGTTGVQLDFYRGLLSCYRGDLDAAAARHASAVTKLPTLEAYGSDTQVDVVLLGALLATAHGDLAAARRDLEPLWELASDDRMSCWLARDVLLLARLEGDLAAQASPRRRAVAESRQGQGRTLIEELRSRIQPNDPADAWNAQLDAELSRIDGASDPALWQRAVDAWAATGRVHDQAWALVRLAESQVSADDREGAAASLVSARAIGTDLRARPLLAAVDELARRAKLSVASRESDRPPVEGTHGLTARELEVLGLIAQGFSNDEIARSLFISPKTVSVHVSRVLAKLDVASRSQATTVAHRRGLLAADAPRE